MSVSTETFCFQISTVARLFLARAKLGAAAIMFKCMPFLCNRHVDYVNKSNCNLSSVPDEVLRYGRTLEELLLDCNQIKDLPKVGKLHLACLSVGRIIWPVMSLEILRQLEVSTQLNSTQQRTTDAGV